MEYEVDILKRVDVIGMTTTKMAKMRKHFECLNCEIIIAEEAAEALEPHITATMPPSTQ